MQSTAEAAATSLLLALSDDELARYGEIARDQADAEWSGWWLYLLLALCAPIVFALALSRWGLVDLGPVAVVETGFGYGVAFALAAAAIFAYVPYRRVRNWALWMRHIRAVEHEQVRRASTPTGVRVDVAR